MIAKDIAKKIGGDPIFAKVEPVNAYVNMFLARDVYVKDTVGEIIDKGDSTAAAIWEKEKR